MIVTFKKPNDEDSSKLGTLTVVPENEREERRLIEFAKGRRSYLLLGSKDSSTRRTKKKGTGK